MPGIWSVSDSEQRRRNSFFHDVLRRLASRYFVPWQNRAIVSIHVRQSSNHPESNWRGASRPSGQSEHSHVDELRSACESQYFGPAMHSSTDSFLSQEHASALLPPSGARGASVHSTFYIEQVSQDADRGIAALLQAGERIHGLERELQLVVDENRRHSEANHELVDAIADIEVHSIILAEERTRYSLELRTIEAQLAFLLELKKSKAIQQPAECQAAVVFHPQSGDLASSATIGHAGNPCSTSALPGMVDVSVATESANEKENPTALLAILGSVLWGAEMQDRWRLVEAWFEAWQVLSACALFEREQVWRSHIWVDALEGYSLLTERQMGGKYAAALQMWSAQLARDEGKQEITAPNSASHDAVRQPQSHILEAEVAHSSSVVMRLKKELMEERHASAVQREELHRQVTYLRTQLHETEAASMRREQVLTEQLSTAVQQRADCDASIAALADGAQWLRTQAEVSAERVEALSCERHQLFEQTLVLSVTSEDRARAEIAKFESNFRIHAFILPHIDHTEKLLRMEVQRAETRERAIRCHAFVELIERKWRKLVENIYERFVAVAYEQLVDLNQMYFEVWSSKQLQEVEPHLQFHDVEMSGPFLSAEQGSVLIFLEATTRVHMEEEFKRSLLSLYEASRRGHVLWLDLDSMRIALSCECSRGATIIDAVADNSFASLRFSFLRGEVEAHETAARRSVEAGALLALRLAHREHARLVTSDLVEKEYAERAAIVAAARESAFAVASAECYSAAITSATSAFGTLRETWEFAFASLQLFVREEHERAVICVDEADRRELLLLARDSLPSIFRVPGLDIAAQALGLHFRSQRTTATTLELLRRSGTVTLMGGAFRKWQGLLNKRALHRARCAVALEATSRGALWHLRRRCLLLWYNKWDAKSTRLRALQSIVDRLCLVSKISQRARIFHRWAGWWRRTKRQREQQHLAQWLGNVTTNTFQCRLFRSWAALAVNRNERSRCQMASLAAISFAAQQRLIRRAFSRWSSNWMLRKHINSDQGSQSTIITSDAAVETAHFSDIVLQSDLEGRIIALIACVENEASERERFKVAEEAGIKAVCFFAWLPIREAEMRGMLERWSDAAWQELLECMRSQECMVAPAISHSNEFVGDVCEAALVRSLVLISSSEREARAAVMSVENMLRELITLAMHSTIRCELEMEEQNCRLELEVAERRVAELMLELFSYLAYICSSASDMMNEEAFPLKCALVAHGMLSLHSCFTLQLSESACRSVTLELENIVRNGCRIDFDLSLHRMRTPSLIWVHATQTAGEGMARSPPLTKIGQVWKSADAAATTIEHELPPPMQQLEHSSPAKLPYSGRPCFGIYISNTLLASRSPGVFVVSLRGEAAELLREGDFIVAINGHPTPSVSSALDAIDVRNTVLTRSELLRGAADIIVDVLRFTDDGLDSASCSRFEITPMLDPDFPSIDYATLV